MKYKITMQSGKEHVISYNESTIIKAWRDFKSAKELNIANKVIDSKRIESIEVLDEH